MSDANLLDRYQDYRTRQFAKRERTYAHSLPKWRTRSRRLNRPGSTGGSIYWIATSGWSLRWAS